MKQRPKPGVMIKCVDCKKVQEFSVAPIDEDEPPVPCKRCGGIYAKYV